MSLVSSLRITDLIGGSNALAWVDTQGFLRKFETGDDVLLPTSVLLNDGSRPMLNTYVPTGIYDIATKGYVDSHSSVPDTWSTFPATSDVNMAGFELNGVGSMSFIAGGNIGADEWDNSSFSSLFLTPNSNFGINNGEAGGSGGENINLVSENGRVVIGSYMSFQSQEDTISSSTYDSMTVASVGGNNSAFVMKTPIGQESSFTLRDINDNVSNNGIVFFSPAGTYDMGIAVAGVGSIWNCKARSGIMSFTSTNQFFGASDDDGSGAQVQIFGDILDGKPALSVQNGPIYVGLISDDGSGASIQASSSGFGSGDISASGSYWSGGIVGVSGTMLDGSVVTGGIITHIGP